MSFLPPKRLLAATIAISAAQSAIALSSSAISESFLPLPGLLNFDFSVPELKRVELKVNPISGEAEATATEGISARKVIENNVIAGKGAVCFVVRRPG